ncbi:MAG TPA: CopG family transcriptional regulator [Dehalococcoidia bacterium]|nr:CopG family transcriptional regulator [Dehalococcoidia bacterium]
MERTTISLPPELHRKLRIMAAERGISMAGLIREAIEEKTVTRPQPKPVSLGIDESEYTDTSILAGEVRPVPRSWR